MGLERYEHNLDTLSDILHRSPYLAAIYINNNIKTGVSYCHGKYWKVSTDGKKGIFEQIQPNSKKELLAKLDQLKSQIKSIEDTIYKLNNQQEENN